MLHRILCVFIWFHTSTRSSLCCLILYHQFIEIFLIKFFIVTIYVIEYYETFSCIYWFRYVTQNYNSTVGQHNHVIWILFVNLDCNLSSITSIMCEYFLWYLGMLVVIPIILGIICLDTIHPNKNVTIIVEDEGSLKTIMYFILLVSH